MAGVVLGVGAVVYLLDRLTKGWALSALAENEPREFIGSVLRLRLIFNPGAAFSLGTGATPLFTVIQAVVSIAVLVAATRVGRLRWAVALGLVLGGATGNLTDRLTRPPGFGLGHVVDFLELPNFPVFNIADSAIVAAACLVALLSLRGVPFGTVGTVDSVGSVGSVNSVGTVGQTASGRTDTPTTPGTMGDSRPGVLPDLTPERTPEQHRGRAPEAAPRRTDGTADG